MLKRMLSYYLNTVHPWETLYSRLFFRKKNKKKSRVFRIGFCSVFPPFHNGAAAGAYYILQELSKHTEIELFLIPLKKKIDKTLFSFMPLHFTTLNDPTLDVIIFWCLGDDYPLYAKHVASHCKTIAWQTMHNNPSENPREQQTFDAIKNADCILATTRWGYHCYKKQVTNVAYLPYGVNPTLFSPRPKNQKIHEKFQCLFVSRINYYKGIMPLLHAIPLVLDNSKNNDVYFKIIAPFDKHSLYLDEINTTLSLLKEKYPKNVEIDTSWIPYTKILDIYRDASVLIFSSNNEGFGIPLVEAMSTEIPCIVLNKKPMSEIVTDKITGFCLNGMQNTEKYHGFLFPHPKDIAKKILVLKHNSRIRKRLGENGRRRVLEEYDLSSIITQLVQHCKELTQK